MKRDIKWVKVISVREPEAKMYKELLENSGIPVFYTPGAHVTGSSVPNTPCIIKVPEERLKEARELLNTFNIE